MRSLMNQLGDPGLHLLAIALVLVYLAFGRGFPRDEDPLPTCNRCHGPYLPGTTCDCRYPVDMAHAARHRDFERSRGGGSLGAAADRP